MARSPLLVVAALALLAALAGVRSQYHTKVEILADECEQKVGCGWGWRVLQGVWVAGEARGCGRMLWLPTCAALCARSGPPHGSRPAPPAPQLDWLWGNYTSPPVVPVAGCDAACLSACYHTLQWAVYSEKLQDCPTQDAIIKCFHVRGPRRGGGCLGARRPARAHPVQPAPCPAHPAARSPTAPSGTSLSRTARCSSGAPR